MGSLHLNEIVFAAHNHNTGEATINTQSTETSVPELPKEKQTSLALYVTSTQAYGKWEEAPEAVKILDVRTPEEYIFVGHPEMAVNIPLAFQTHRWNEETRLLRRRAQSLRSSAR